MKKMIYTLSTSVALSAIVTPTAFADSYVVKPGDTLDKIAREHSTSVSELKALNKLTTDKIYMNQTLVLGKISENNPTLYNSLDSESVKVHTVVIGDTLTKIANTYGMTIAEIKLLNNLKSTTLTIGDKLFVSDEKIVETMQVIEKAATKTTETRVVAPNTSVLSASVYTVQSGDSLWKIASNNGMTVSSLKSLNNLTSDIIRVGQVLKLNQSNTGGNVVSPSKPNSVGGAASTSYTVKSGDSLWKIATANNMTVNELKQLNNLSSDSIYVGQVLVLKQSSNNGSNANPGGNQTTPAPPSKPNQSTSTYVVKAGDTLSKIAQSFGMSVAELKELNNLTSDAIYVNQQLKVSGSVEKPTEPAPPSTPQTPSNSAQKVIQIAKQFIGVPYVWAGSSPSGFDCSGYVYYVFKQSGYSIPRLSSSTYYDMGKKVSSPQPGDLIFFDTATNTNKVISHMGIYLGNNEFIHASESKGITITSVTNSYWKSRVVGYSRL